jgi:hypothetical protein
MAVDLAALAADLREARRYVKCNPDEARRQAGACVDSINGMLDRSAGGPRELALSRLATNISVGMRFVLVSPDLLACYLGTAAEELDVLVGASAKVASS